VKTFVLFESFLQFISVNLPVTEPCEKVWDKSY